MITLIITLFQEGAKPREVSISVASSIMDIPAADWDACACDPAGPEEFNPFLTHAFLSSLEESGSAVKVSIWNITADSLLRIDSWTPHAHSVVSLLTHL